MDAIAIACQHGNVEKLRRLINEGVMVTATEEPDTSITSPTPLMLAVMYDHLECVELLMEAGTDLNVACGPDLETALHVSCARGKVDHTKALLRAGADLGVADAHGRSPLLIACLANQPECAAILVDAGADLEQPMAGNNPGATPLYAASSSASAAAAAARIPASCCRTRRPCCGPRFFLRSVGALAASGVCCCRALRLRAPLCVRRQCL